MDRDFEEGAELFTVLPRRAGLSLGCWEFFLLHLERE